ncbi:MAG: hypothetical protein LBS68_03125, partial [Puniceicoccales bacterium]|nr:hypothetical protein [Puniceicoccales bacterium]
MEPVISCEELYFVSSGNIRYAYDWGSIILKEWDEEHKDFIDKALQYLFSLDVMPITAENPDDSDDWGDDISTESIIHFFFPFLHRNRKASIAARTTAVNFSGDHVESIVDGWMDSPPPPAFLLFSSIRGGDLSTDSINYRGCSFVLGGMHSVENRGGKLLVGCALESSAGNYRVDGAENADGKIYDHGINLFCREEFTGGAMAGFLIRQGGGK